MTSIRLYVVVFLTAKMVLFCVVDGILYSINLTYLTFINSLLDVFIINFLVFKLLMSFVYL